MATTSEYLSQLQTDKTNLVSNLVEKGVEATNNETFTELVPKVCSIKSTPMKINKKDVNFYDYDGTLLYSYTLQEIENMTEMPQLPSQDGLTCQGWNWTLSEIKEHSSKVNVGAIYITDNGDTRIYISVDEITKKLYLHFAQTVNNGYAVDWGDGSELETVNSTQANVFHEYENIGDYTVLLKPLISNNVFSFRSSSSGGTILFTKNETLFDYDIDNKFLNIVKRIEIGSNITILESLSNLKSVRYVTIPNNVAVYNNSPFKEWHSLLWINMPNNFSARISGLLQNCYSLRGATFPKKDLFGSNAFTNCNSITEIVIPLASIIENYCFNACYALKKIILPDTISEIKSNAFAYCGTLNKVNIPNNITEISSGLFNSCGSLTQILFPSGISTIGGSAFYYCGVEIYDFSQCTSVPTMTGAAFINRFLTYSKIIVPDELYEDWIVATNWASVADYIIKESEFNNA